MFLSLSISHLMKKTIACIAYATDPFHHIVIKNIPSLPGVGFVNNEGGHNILTKSLDVSCNTKGVFEVCIGAFSVMKPLSFILLLMNSLVYKEKAIFFNNVIQSNVSMSSSLTLTSL